MPEEALSKHTLNLYKGDYDRLAELYPDVGAAPVIRRIVRKFLESLETQTDTAMPRPEVKL